MKRPKIYEIKVCDYTGNWFVARTVSSMNEQQMMQNLDQVQMQFPDRRVKLVESNSMNLIWGQ